jgi:hypothetical protein
MTSGRHEHRDATGDFGIRIRLQAFGRSRRCRGFSVIRRRASSGADLSGVHLEASDLSGADLSQANLSRANLSRVTLIGVNLCGADLTGCCIHGVSAWRVKLDAAKQQDLIITHPYEPEITVDNIEVAQFVYLLLHNEKIRDVIDTITSKVVLILGRFTDERKAVLDAIRDKLRELGPE